jgi:hypothetical protein
VLLHRFHGIVGVLAHGALETSESIFILEIRCAGRLWRLWREWGGGKFVIRAGLGKILCVIVVDSHFATLRTNVIGLRGGCCRCGVAAGDDGFRSHQQVVVLTFLASTADFIEAVQAKDVANVWLVKNVVNSSDKLPIAIPFWQRRIAVRTRQPAIPNVSIPLPWAMMRAAFCRWGRYRGAVAERGGDNVSRNAMHKRPCVVIAAIFDAKLIGVFLGDGGDALLWGLWGHDLP